MNVDSTTEPLNPASVPTKIYEGSPYDYFQIVTSRKRRRKDAQQLTLNQIRAGDQIANQLTTTSKYLIATNDDIINASQTPTTSLVKNMVKNLEKSDRGASDASMSDNPTKMMLRSGTHKRSDFSLFAEVTPDVNTSNPATTYMLKEIEDNHNIAVIYANKGLEDIKSSSMLLGFPGSQVPRSNIVETADGKNELTELSEEDDDLMKGSSMAKKKGRPVGSKNKKNSGDQNGLSNSPS